MIAPRIFAGTNGQEAIAAFGVGEGVTAAAEIGIEWGVVLIDFVEVASGGIRLPDFDESSGDRAVIFIDHPATHDDSFAERCAAVLARQIALACSYVLGCKPRTGDFSQGGWNRYQRLGRCPFAALDVRMMRVIGLRAWERFSIA